MENAVEALKMAAAVIVFVLALSIAIFMFSKARATADVVLQASDKTEYYDYEEYTKNEKNKENRIVGLETIIPVLYKYNKENYKVIFDEGTFNSTTGEYKITGALKIYETKTNPNTWDKSYINSFDGTKTNRAINSFDLSEEIKRHESWTISREKIKDNITAIINGNSEVNKTYLNNPLKKKNNRYLELIGRIKRDISDKNQTIDKTVIT